MQSTSPLLIMKPLPLLLLVLALVLAGGGLWWLSRSSDPPKRRPAAADTRPRAQSSSERLRTALRDTDRGRRSARFATVWSGLTAAEAATLAPELLAHEAGSPFQNDWLDFLQRWGALDPRAALAFAAARGGGLAGDWTRAIARGWATADPPAAAAWWLGEASSDRDALGSLIIGRWAGTDWPAAADWIHSHVPPADQPGLVNALAMQIIEHHPETASSLVNACRGRAAPPTALETSLFNHLARSMPIEWLEPLKDLFPHNPALIERVRLMMDEAITETQPPQPGAKEWLFWLAKPENRPVPASPFMEPDLRPQESAFRHWLAADPEEASRWLGALEPSATRDGLARVIVLATANEDPVAAQEWLRSMSAENRRNLYLNWPSHSIPESLDWLVEFMKADGFHPEALRAR
jgi:hypothetical protein